LPQAPNSERRAPRVVGFLLGLGLTCGYWPQAYADEEVGRWAIGCVLLAVLLWFRSPVRASALGLAFLTWVALSFVWVPFPLDGLWEMSHWAFLVWAFLIGASELAAPVFEGAAWGLAVNSALAIGQMFGLDIVQQASVPAGFFGNRDFLAETTLLAIVPLLAARRWRMAAALLPALLLPQSRAVLAVGAVLALIWGWGRSRIAAAVACAMLVLATVAVTYVKHLHSDEVRLDIWLDAWNATTWLGQGVGQFYATFPTHAVLFGDGSRPEHVHNDWLEILYEHGPIGAALALLFAVDLARRGGRWGFAWLAFCGLCAVSFALHNPATAILGFLAGGSVHGAGALVRRGVAQPAGDDLRRSRRRRFFGNPRFGSPVAAGPPHAARGTGVALL
jgi:hypothetical protein